MQEALACFSNILYFLWNAITLCTVAATEHLILLHTSATIVSEQLSASLQVLV